MGLHPRVLHSALPIQFFQLVLRPTSNQICLPCMPLATDFYLLWRLYGDNIIHVGCGLIAILFYFYFLFIFLRSFDFQDVNVLERAC